MENKRKLLHAVHIAIVIIFLLPCLSCKERPKAESVMVPDLNFLFSNKDMQLLGEKLFFDRTLSEPEGQSCASCHGPEVGWTGPDESVNKTGGVYSGAVNVRFGNRKPNSAAYATLSPQFHVITENGKVVFEGGNFWDGRATGYVLGNPAADQARGPFLNPVEQNNPGPAVVVEKVCRSGYATLLNKVGEEIWGVKDICKSNDINLLYGIIGIAIASYENSEKVNQFTSKFDYYLKGRVKLTERERKGLELFNGKGKCALCHISNFKKGEPLPLFTDFRFENLGIPKNPLNPWYSMDTTFNKEGVKWIDAGLADYIKGSPQYAMLAKESYGKHQVPTVRNVDKRPSPGFVKAFGHNGYFKSLEEIVHFYNTRDILPSAKSVQDPKPGINCWPEAEVPENINKEETGILALSAEEESDIVEFLKTLSDGYELK
jgi:cytochrome c peroxidase